MSPRKKIDPLSQRELALALRYHIDQSQRRGEPHGDIARQLIANNPHAFASRHVQHNLGQWRLAWVNNIGGENGPDPAADGA